MTNTKPSNSTLAIKRPGRAAQALISGAAGAMLALTMACTVEAPNAGIAADEVDTTVLAELTTADGATYTFLAIESGDVAVEVVAPAAVDASLLSGAHTSLTALYESISGEPAPEALVLAERRADENSASSTEVHVQPLQFDPGALKGTITLALTAAEFAATYCPGGYDFLYCWPDTGGNPWVQRTSTYFAGAMNATNCHTRFRYRYYDGGWKTFRDRIAAPGEHFWYWMSGSKTSRRWEILNNGGCGVRFSAWGND
jgi:hypothetical protein